MSKPLVFFLQLVGLVLIFGGLADRPELIVIGIILVVIGGIGIRARFKTQVTQNKPESMSELVNVLKEQNEMLKKQLEKK